MEGHTIEETANLLKQPAEYLRNKILFADKPHPILKPCVFIPEPISSRIFNSYGIINKCEVDNKKKTVPVPCSDGRIRDCSYYSANISGLFQLTFFPENFDMTEAKESGRIQLYRAKAVFADLLAEFSIDMAVGWIMNNWQHFNDLKNRWEPSPPSEVSETKSHVTGKIGECVILTQNGIHYLVDSPVSVPLSDIRISDKMLAEYAVSEGIILSKPKVVTTQPIISTPTENVKTFTQEEVAVILKINFDDVFKTMMGGHDVLLQSSVVIKKPVQMQRTEFASGNPNDYGRGAKQIIVTEELAGIFGIEGVRPLQWDEHGLAQLTFGEWPPDLLEGRYGNTSGVLLSHGGHTYMVKDPLKIRREELVVTAVDLLQYGKETIGVTFELPQTEPKQEQAAEITATATQPDSDDPPALKESAQNASTPQSFDLLEYVKQCKAAKQSNEQICYDLMVDHGQSKKYSKLNTDRLSALAIGIAVFPGQTYGSPKEKDALESKVWKKIESHHQKVTK